MFFLRSWLRHLKLDCKQQSRERRAQSANNRRKEISKFQCSCSHVQDVLDYCVISARYNQKFRFFNNRCNDFLSLLSCERLIWCFVLFFSWNFFWSGGEESKREVNFVSSLRIDYCKWSTVSLNFRHFSFVEAKRF